MEEQRKVPQIRFKGFTDDWEQRKLFDVAEYRNGKAHENDIDEDGIYIVVNSKFVSTDGEVKKYSNKQNEPLLKNEIAFVLSDVPNGRAIAKTFLVEKSNKYTLNQRIAGITPHSDINPKFLSVTMNRNKYFLQFDDGVKQTNLSLDDMKQFEEFYPRKMEQDKIGEIFSNIDNLITLHQRKCDKLVEVKKSLLEKMFPKNSSKIPEIRFKGFTDDWEQRKLSDFGIATGGTSIESEFSSNGKYKVISIGSYSENSNYNDQGIRAIHSDKTKTRVLNKEDLTMILNDKTASGRIIGRVLYIDKSGEYVYNQRTERIEINRELYNPKFIYHLLNAPEMRNKIIKQSQGNTQIFVNWNGIKNTEYLIPHLNEQARLEKIFANIDNLITLHQRKLEKLKEVKKSMLEKMFV